MNYKYDIIRSTRKSISINISTQNKITVRCPWEMRPEEIEKFLDSKEDWIEKVVLNNSLKLASNDDILELKKIYLAGKKLVLVFSDRNYISEDCVYVKSEKDIEKLYVKSLFDGFKKRVNELSEQTKLYPASVSVKNYKGRWGCCDSKNNLIFNFKLFMLPKEVQDYVIVHELCHTLCHNHSFAFWRLVSEFIPNYKEIRTKLQNYDFLTLLY